VHLHRHIIDVLDEASLHVEFHRVALSFHTTAFGEELSPAARTVKAGLLCILILPLRSTIIIGFFHKQAELFVEVFQLEL